MSQHRSFGASGTAGSGHRSVLKRYEKIQLLSSVNKWTEEKGIYALPKVKVLKLKAKKVAKVAKEDDKATGDKAAAKPAKPVKAAKDTKSK